MKLLCSALHCLALPCPGLQRPGLHLPCSDLYCPALLSPNSTKPYLFLLHLLCVLSCVRVVCASVCVVHTTQLQHPARGNTTG